jgi:hypothetical protein
LIFEGVLASLGAFSTLTFGFTLDFDLDLERLACYFGGLTFFFAYSAGFFLLTLRFNLGLFLALLTLLFFYLLGLRLFLFRAVLCLLSLCLLPLLLGLLGLRLCLLVLRLFLLETLCLLVLLRCLLTLLFGLLSLELDTFLFFRSGSGLFTFLAGSSFFVLPNGSMPLMRFPLQHENLKPYEIEH